MGLRSGDAGAVGDTSHLACKPTAELGDLSVACVEVRGRG